MDWTLETLARLVVGGSSLSLLVVGLAVLGWEAATDRGPAEERDTGPLALVNYVAILGFAGVGFLSAATLVGTSRMPSGMEAADGIIRIAGIVVVLAAGLLAGWGLRSIGGDMASAAEVRADTQLITSRAFALVRHPLYLSLLLLWLGAAMALLSWLMGLCWIALIPAFVARSRLEEAILTRHFGEAYCEYAERVPMLLPLPVLARRRRSTRAVKKGS